MNSSFELVRQRRGRYLAAFCLINFCTGALYVWSVFAGPLSERLSMIAGSAVTTAQLGSVFGLATGITPVLMLAGGIVNDRMGPRAVISLGGLAIAAGYLLSAFASSASMLYLTYGLLVGAGTGLVNGCTINTAVKFFPDRRGFAGGAVTACLGIGAAVLPLAAGALIASVGIELTFIVFGLVSGVIIVAAALVTAKCPDNFASAFAAPGRRTSVSAVDLNWLGMLKSPTFVPLAILFIMSTTMGLMLLSNIANIARSQVGVSTAAAAMAVSVISIANTAGRFVSGSLSDRLGRIPTLAITLLLALAGFALLSAAGTGDTTLFFTGITAIGLCFGAFVGIYPGLVADEYGARHNSVNFSVMAFGYSIGGFAGPMLLRWADTGDGFTRAYFVCAAAAVIGLACAGFYLLIKRRQTSRGGF